MADLACIGFSFIFVKLKGDHKMDKRISDKKKPSICCDCQYLGDKHSFPEPNDFVDVEPANPFIKHYYCCCGDCKLYAQDVTCKNVQKCSCFEEL